MGEIECLTTARVPNRSHINPQPEFTFDNRKPFAASPLQDANITHRSNIVFDQKTGSVDFQIQKPIPIMTRMSISTNFVEENKQFGKGNQAAKINQYV